MKFNHDCDPEFHLPPEPDELNNWPLTEAELEELLHDNETIPF